MKWEKDKQGFTIVELLIVVVVIAILAAITIVSYNGIQSRAREAQVQSDTRSLVQAIVAARISTGKTLREITNSTDSRGTKALSDAAIDAISSASGVNLAGIKKGDPWGNYYRIDENELELNATDCRQDSIAVSNHPEYLILIPLSKSPCI